MRINTINNNYVMIGLDEAKKIIHDNKFPKEIISKIAKALFIVSLTEDEFGNSPYYFGVKRETFDKDSEFFKNYIISIESLQNVFMYAVTHNCDKDILQMLGQLVNFRCKIRLSSLIEDYGEVVAEYILKHCDYDYKINKSQRNIEDSDFILFDEGDTIRINLKQREVVPTLQNPDVK